MEYTNDFSFRSPSEFNRKSKADSNHIKNKNSLDKNLTTLRDKGDLSIINFSIEKFKDLNPSICKNHIFDFDNRLKAYIDRLPVESDSLKLKLNEQRAQLNNIVKKIENPNEKEFLFNDLKNHINEIQGLLVNDQTSPSYLNKIKTENLIKQSTVVNKDPSIMQVEVLNQIYDNVGSGTENCGYHSLKNTLCLIAELSLNAPFENSFRDPQVYEVFYQRYASPLLIHLPIGKRDASTPLLREMIHAFVTDSSPPKEIAAFQKVLKNSLENHLGIFTIFPGTNDLGVRFGLFDEAGFKDAKKIYQFSQEPGPAFFTCPVGNVNTGHWYALAIIKNRDGSLDFFGCDSLEQHQRGGASPLGKMSSLFLETLSEPKAFLDYALTSFVESIEHYGDWLDSKGLPDSEQSRMQLIDNSKGPLNLARSSIIALENMLEQNWHTSSDIQKLSRMQRIENLVRFYARELPEISEEGKTAPSALKKVENQFNFDSSIESLMASISDHLNSIAQTPPAKPNTENIKRTENTFNQMLLLYKNRVKVASEKDQVAREGSAHQLTGAGVESGFIPGKSIAEAIKSIEYRTILLVSAYQKAQGMGKEEEFYKSIGSGDPCITARMGRVEELFGQLNNLGDFQQDLLSDKIFGLSDVAIMNVIDQMIDEGLNSEEINQLTSKDIDPIHFANELKKLGNYNSAIPFKDYLVRMNICENKENIDWDKVAIQLIASNDFKKMLKRGKDLASMNY